MSRSPLKHMLSDKIYSITLIICLFNKTNPVTDAAGFVFAIKKDVKLKGRQPLEKSREYSNKHQQNGLFKIDFAAVKRQSTHKKLQTGNHAIRTAQSFSD